MTSKTWALCPSGSAGLRGHPAPGRSGRANRRGAVGCPRRPAGTWRRTTEPPRSGLRRPAPRGRGSSGRPWPGISSSLADAEGSAPPELRSCGSGRPAGFRRGRRSDQKLRSTARGVHRAHALPRSRRPERPDPNAAPWTAAEEPGAPPAHRGHYATNRGEPQAVRFSRRLGRGACSRL